MKPGFAPNPNTYHANGHGKLKKAKPSQGPRVDLSPHLELQLNVECDVVQEHEADMEWWLSVMR